MQIEPRPYREPADLSHMRRLLVEGARASTLASYMHPGSLDWEVFYPPDEAANRRNILLWERAGEGGPALLAWAIYSRHEQTFDLFVHPAIYDTPAHAAVADGYVAWAEARARAAGLRQIAPFWMFADDAAAARLLRERGFVPVAADPPPPLFERALVDLPVAPPPDGFVVRAVGSRDDGRLRAAVTHAAFRPGDDWDGYWSRYAQFIGSAIYEGERDLFVRAPDGRGAAACTIWLDAVNGVGLFEPVATHPDFQRRGLARAVMAEGLRRMRAAGMRRAILGFDPDNLAARALYTAMGFTATRYFAVYRKDLSAAHS